MIRRRVAALALAAAAIVVGVKAMPYQKTGTDPAGTHPIASIVHPPTTTGRHR